MTYVISDIHGCYEQYKQILCDIEFSEKDELYVIGDVIDRGKGSVKVLLDMMSRPNVFPIMGNHEGMAMQSISILLEEITEDNYKSHLGKNEILDFMDWINNGGETTIDDFHKLSKDERRYVYEYLAEEFSLYEVVTIGGKNFVLAHSGVPEGADLKKLCSVNDYDDLDFIMAETDYNKQYFDDNTFLVTGHIPTMVINPAYKGKIYRNKNNIAIDGGSVFGGTLACLCLDTDEEFYV